MELDRRSFLRAAGSSLVLGAGSVGSGSAQAPASPVSFPGIANPLEGGADVIATGYTWTEGPVWVGGEEGHLLFSDVPGNAIYSWDTDPPYGLAGVQNHRFGSWPTPASSA